VSWLREAISDENNQADMAYIAIGSLTVAAIFSLVFIFAMSAVSYHKCQPITTVAKGEQSTTSVIPCNFDPLPVGQSAGLIFGAFGALIGALAGYMAATRKGPRPQPLPPVTSTVTTTETTTQPLPAEAATDVGPPTIQKARKGKR